MRYLVIGGAGFIGSYLVDYFLDRKETEFVRVYDNFSSGRSWHLERHLKNKGLIIFKNDIYESTINDAVKGVDVVFHFAANPDIAKASIEPDIDFKQGTVLTQIILEAIRMSGCKRLVYASGSGVYGDVDKKVVSEDFQPMEPISTYGASKLGCEALISSYCHMFGITASALRFGNVVGGRQTHGVAYDFIKKLRRDSYNLEILGDGNQSKPYIHVGDVVNSINLVLAKQVKLFDVFNVAPNDSATVKEIALIVLESMNFPTKDCNLKFLGGNRGWRGDVPIVRLNSEKIRSLGWSENYSSLAALKLSVKEMLKNTEYIFN